MKKFIIVVSAKKIIWIVIIVLFICFMGYSIYLYFYQQKYIFTATMEEQDAVTQLEIENKRLKGALDSILPDEKKVMYENPSRLYGDKTISYETFSLSKALEKGKSIDFNILFNDANYMRPMYKSRWKSAYYRGWLSLPSKVSDAHHKIFIFPLGASSNYDFTGEQGGFLNVRIDAHRNKNLLVYNFDVSSVILYENQVALVGEPKRTGAQVISIVQDDLLDEVTNEKDLLFQLSTPDGYEIDYIAGDVIKYAYLKKRIEENTVQGTSTVPDSNSTMTLEELMKENTLIKEELSYYIPLEDDLFITEQKCRNASYLTVSKGVKDIPIIMEKGNAIEFSINYQDKEFIRPIYDPIWGENYQKGWAYVPTKICENMHLLFTVPVDIDNQADFFSNMTLHEEIPLVKENKSGFLVFNFTPEKVMKLDDQIIIVGIPERKGVHVITIDRDQLMEDSNYMIQLVTPDDFEIDYEILVN
ncbi:hypothetical protein [Vallitalea okinawensis]|uniref:hypothetical protein n=1 Tax=Vallitalea okinawensis TaxID=2078660 RepID=UPI000CFD2A0F|nr:hypothetical protein [Vallitalea okinawensis]